MLVPGAACALKSGTQQARVLTTPPRDSTDKLQPIVLQHFP